MERRRRWGVSGLMSVGTPLAGVVGVLRGVGPHYQRVDGRSSVREPAALAIDLAPAAEAAPAPAEAAPEIEPHLTPRKGHTPHHARPAPGTLAVRMPEGPSPLQPPPFEESPANDEGAAGHDGAGVS